MIKKLLLGLRFRLAVHKANRQARRYDRKYLVINVGGRLVTLSKQELTLLIRRGYFHRGITAANIEAHALHVALPRPSSR
nr:MAG TPA: hypothetical protein [Caudoviricetes sp.]